MKRTILIAAGVALATTGPTLAEEMHKADDMSQGSRATAEMTEADQDADLGIEAGDILLSNWDYAEIYNQPGWSVEDMLGTTVYGSGGDDIGDVEDIVIGADGSVTAVIAEIGGFLDIGDTHVAVPWDQVTFPGRHLTVPVTEDTVDDYDVFAYSDVADIGEDVVAGVGGEYLGPRNWRASQLIGDYVRIRGEDGTYVNYGLVNDLLIDDGQIQATIVSATGGFGRGFYAYPYRPYGPGYDRTWRADEDIVDLPYLEGEIRGMDKFDYDRIGSG